MPQFLMYFCWEYKYELLWGESYKHTQQSHMISIRFSPTETIEVETDVRLDGERSERHRVVFWPHQTGSNTDRMKVRQQQPSLLNLNTKCLIKRGK